MDNAQGSVSPNNEDVICGRPPSSLYAESMFGFGLLTKFTKTIIAFLMFMVFVVAGTFLALEGRATKYVDALALFDFLLA